MSILIRRATLADAPEVQALGMQLGYKNTLTEIEERLPVLLAKDDHDVSLSVNAVGEVTGMVHLKVHHSLLVPPQVEVGALVVYEEFRGQGFGRQLMVYSEEWAEKLGYKHVRLTSNIHRTEAHEFYLKLGFKQPKTSHFFLKDI